MSNNSTDTSLRLSRIVSGGSPDTRAQEARRLAAGFLCEQGEAHTRPCLSCRACGKALSGAHPDVITVEPTGATLTVEPIRKARAALRKMPGEGPCHVVVIPEAQTMNRHAQNALLQVLESPPGEAVFLLLCDTAYALLPTVRSRCLEQRLRREEPPLQESPALNRLVSAIESGQDWEMVSACVSLEKMKREEFDLLLYALSAKLYARYFGTSTATSDRPSDKVETSGGQALRPTETLTLRKIGHIIDELETMRQELKGNVSVGHLCGALAAELTGAF